MSIDWHKHYYFGLPSGTMICKLFEGKFGNLETCWWCRTWLWFCIESKLWRCCWRCLFLPWKVLSYIVACDAFWKCWKLVLIFCLEEWFVMGEKHFCWLRSWRCLTEDRPATEIVETDVNTFYLIEFVNRVKWRKSWCCIENVDSIYVCGVSALEICHYVDVGCEAVAIFKKEIFWYFKSLS